MFKNYFTCLSNKANRVLLALLVTLSLASGALSMARTWDGKCIDNETINPDVFLASKNPQMINGKLLEAVGHRGSIIPSMIKMSIDSTVGTYNHSVEYCPWSDPMTLAPRRNDSKLSRDVCYIMKVGSHQIQNAFLMDVNDPNKAADNQKLREENLEEIVDEIKEFNMGHCLADMNPLLFANYEQMLFTVTEFKYSEPDFRAKYDLYTPQNFYFLREKLHGSVRDVVNKKLHFAHEEDVTWHDVILFQMARAVNMIHLRGWVHRDIKNENYYVKKTVDKRIEVRLGEFLGARMSSTHKRVETSVDDETYGGPFYIPADAKNHPDDLGNDYYALGLAMEELITHRSVEDNITQASPKVNLATFDKSEVLVEDKVELKMEEDFDPIFADLNLDNIAESQNIVEERKEERKEEQIKKDSKPQDDALDFSLDSTNMFDVASLDMNFLSIVTPENNKSVGVYRNLSAKRNLSDGRKLSAERNLENKERVLSGGQYGDFDVTSFNIDSGSYGELNFDPHANKEVDKFVVDAENEITDLQVHEEFQILNKEISLPSVDDFILPDNVITFEHAVETRVVESNLNVFKEAETKRDQPATSTTAYNAQQEADKLIRSMASTKYYERFIDLRIFGNANDSEFNAAKSENKNMRGLQLCYQEFNDYKNSGSKGVSSFKSALTTTECLMVFVARSILQSDYHNKGGVNYFNLLDPAFNMNTMNDVFDMIAEDRRKTEEANSKMITFDQYYQLYNRILI
jgi:serine/threonine protein kinase